jgi:hypothetical protein
MSIRTTLVSVLALLPLGAFAADTHLRIPSFSKLQAQAVQSVDVNIGSLPLKFASMLVDKADESGDLKKIVLGVKEVIVRSYSFEKDNAYPKDEIEAVRSQLSGSTWSPIATIRDKNKNENIDVSIAFEKDKVVGVAIVAASPKQFTILNIVGEIGVDQIAALAKQLHVTDNELGRRSVDAL